jgi:curved DNA-binding protein CbpA
MITARRILSELMFEAVRIDYSTDYYGYLGFFIDPGDPLPSQDEIKKNYRDLAKEFHPDRNPGDKEAEEMFKEISRAYEILGNPGLRADYDKHLQSGSAVSPASSGSVVYPQSFYWEHSDYWCSWKQKSGGTDIDCVLVSMNDFSIRLVVTLPGNLRVRCDYLRKLSRSKWESMGIVAESGGIESIGVTFRNLETKSGASDWRIFPAVKDSAARFTPLSFVYRDKRQ